MKNSTRSRIIEISELLAGSILPIIFWISVIFGFDTPDVAILTIISAVIHESGHCIAILFFSKSTPSLRGHSTGFRIRQEKLLSYSQEIGILLAGPCMNLLIFLITLPFVNALHGYVRILGYINLATGISNLLPLEGYDGYGAISMLLKNRGAGGLIKFLESFSFILSVTLTFISLHLIDIFGEGYWIFGLFFFTAISKLIKMGKYDIFEE